MNTDEYLSFEEACVADMRAKQEHLVELLLFDAQVDLSQERIRFLDEQEVFVEAEIVLIGSRGLRSESWIWGWANPSMSDALRARSSGLKQLGLRTGREEFLSEKSFSATEREAWDLVAIACCHLDGVGIYRTTVNDSDWFFLIQKLTHFKSPEVFQRKAQQAAENTLRGAQGAVKLNMLRKRFPEMRLYLQGADLRGDSQPWARDLHAQILVDLDRLKTHKPHDLTGANLSFSRFDGAILRGVTLRDASFEGSSLVDADLSGVDARGVSFRDTFLNGVNFTRANLAGADFAGAELARTLLTDVDLSEVKGLDEVHHCAGSEISLSTLISSHFEITPSFLRKAGVSRGLIEDLMKGKRFSKTYQTCFLSYSSKDEEFAAQLYNSLAEAGVRVFWDHFDVIPGEYLEDQIVEAIREHDRLLVLLSAQSMVSKWVMREIELAWYHKRESLLPVRLCPIEEVRHWTEKHDGLPDLTRVFPILDFSGWRVREHYDHAFSLLLRSFSGGVDFRPNDDPLSEF